MKRLSKEQVQEKDNLMEKVQKAHEELSRVVDDYNEAVERAWDDVTSALSDLNTLVGDFNEFLDSTHTQMQDFFDDQPEEWQESDSADAFIDWLGAWEDRLEELEISKPEELEAPDFDDLEVFDSLPNNPEEVYD